MAGRTTPKQLLLTTAMELAKWKGTAPADELGPAQSLIDAVAAGDTTEPVLAHPMTYWVSDRFNVPWSIATTGSLAAGIGDDTIVYPPLTVDITAGASGDFYGYADPSSTVPVGGSITPTTFDLPNNSGSTLLIAATTSDVLVPGFTGPYAFLFDFEHPSGVEEVDIQGVQVSFSGNTMYLPKDAANSTDSVTAFALDGADEPLVETLHLAFVDSASSGPLTTTVFLTFEFIARP